MILDAIRRVAASRAVLAGIALSAPFVANPLPSNAWGLIVVIPFALHVLRYGFSLSDLRVNPMIAAIGAVIALHGASLIGGPTPYYFAVLRDIAMALAACAMVMLVKPTERVSIIDGFFGATMVVAVVASIAGLVKFGLMANGILIPAFVKSCGVDYPQGSSLCGDYNLFGLLLIVGSAGFVRALATSASVSWWRVACLALLVFALVLSGSRRAVFLFPVVIVYWLAITVALRINIRRVVLPMSAVAAAAIAGIVLPGINIHTVKAADGKQEIVVAPSMVDDGNHQARQLRKESDFVVRDNSVAALATTFSAEEGYGVGSRIEKWRLAWNMIKERPLFGHGFGYHQRFACQFIKCAHIDYPHAPLLSGWIAGGVFGLAIILAFYGVALSAFYVFWRTGWFDGSLLVLLAALPFSAISGDTVLSIPQFLIAALLAWRLQPGMSFRPITA